MYKKPLSIIVAVCLFSPFVSADELVINPKIIETCNEVMANIFLDILEKKDRYKELSHFGEHTVYENEYGIISIHYQTIIGEERINQQRYEFWLSIIGLDDINIFQSEEGSFEHRYPLLKIKLAGYQSKTQYRDKFKLKVPAERRSLTLLELQQESLPFQLSLEPAKEKFLTNEKIDFKVILKNVSKNSIKLKELNSQTLKFLYDGEPWDLDEQDKKAPEKVVIKPNEKIEKSYTIEGPSVPREFELFTTYSMTYKGVKPSTSATFKIIR